MVEIKRCTITSPVVVLGCCRERGVVRDKQMLTSFPHAFWKNFVFYLRDTINPRYPPRVILTKNMSKPLHYSF